MAGRSLSHRIVLASTCSWTTCRTSAAGSRDAGRARRRPLAVMPPPIAAVGGVAFAFLFGALVGAIRRRRRRGLGPANLDLMPWYRGGPTVVLESRERDEPGNRLR